MMINLQDIHQKRELISVGIKLRLVLVRTKLRLVFIRVKLWVTSLVIGELKLEKPINRANWCKPKQWIEN